jgi:hypothetical protein
MLLKPAAINKLGQNKPSCASAQELCAPGTLVCEITGTVSAAIVFCAITLFFMSSTGTLVEGKPFEWLTSQSLRITFNAKLTFLTAR